MGDPQHAAGAQGYLKQLQRVACAWAPGEVAWAALCRQLASASFLVGCCQCWRLPHSIIVDPASASLSCRLCHLLLCHVCWCCVCRIIWPEMLGVAALHLLLDCSVGLCPEAGQV